MQQFLNLRTIDKAAYAYGERSSGETHGVVLTKPHIVDMILDLAGYTPDRDLAALSLLEPACGNGAFLIRALDRLLESRQRFHRSVADLDSALLAFDIDPRHVATTRTACADLLTAHGASPADAARLTLAWIREDDFLLADMPHVDIVVGNPPYVRTEQLSPELQAEYRRRFKTLYDRADLYVAFIETGLSLLKPTGVLSFICADRWTVNKYGGPLRQFIAKSFHVRHYIDLHTGSPFESDVIAYPSIFVLDAQRQVTSTTVGRLKTGSAAECETVVAECLYGNGHGRTCTAVYPTWFADDEPWVVSSPEQLAVLRMLEDRFPTLEETGDTRVGIGVATGCDAAFIVGQDADIERDRLVPLVMREDIAAGAIRDGKRFVINTFDKNGKAIDLAAHPRLAAHFQRYPAVAQRHVAQKNAKAWFRTIDRVYPELVTTPKLLVPDIAGANEVTYDAGHYHPHHNLYFVTSSAWDLEVLGGLLSSKVALFFVWSYATKMRGGYLRFQAQYLRRIRVPEPTHLALSLAAEIRDAFRSQDFALLDALALTAYGLSSLPIFDFVDTRARRIRAAA